MVDYYVDVEIGMLVFVVEVGSVWSGLHIQYPCDTLIVFIKPMLMLTLRGTKGL